VGIKKLTEDTADRRRITITKIIRPTGPEESTSIPEGMSMAIRRMATRGNVVSVMRSLVLSSWIPLEGVRGGGEGREEGEGMREEEMRRRV
jgi:hypothetical protein